MLGGFLGAGKTTALARLARMYQQLGRRVGLVTNDQAQNLVDTNSLRAQGLTVAEVPGACFCCRFDDLVAKVGSLEENERPDVVLAEPVGSCTDLVATVIQPLKDLYGERFQVAPYAVLFKPSHGRKILGGEADAGFSPKAAYIFQKQLEEADTVILNRIDELPPAEIEELSRLVSRQYPQTPLLRVSARIGVGFDALLQLLDQDGGFGRRILDIDYDIYAEGEAELGWLNSSVRLSATREFALDDLLLELLTDLRRAMQELGGEIAHLKVIALTDATYAVANLVSTAAQPELSLPSRAAVSESDLIVNARVAVDPDLLRQRVEQALKAASASRAGTLEFRQTQCLRPGRPVPTHRYAVPV
jgi:Ni2+-binding GTPase involved in maturation of urease and hydrogenase